MAENLRIPEMNKTIIVGRITRDLELRYTPSNLAVTTMSVAVNRNFKDTQTGEWKESTSFVPVVVWGKQAELANERLKKGSAVYVEGRLQSRNWETKQGEKRSTLEVICERIQFLTKSEAAADGNKPGFENTAVNVPKAKTAKQADTAWDVEENVENLDEEIPF